MKNIIYSAFHQKEDTEKYKENNKTHTYKMVVGFYISAAGLERIGEAPPSRDEDKFIEGMGTLKDNKIHNDFPKNWWQKEFRKKYEFMILLANDEEKKVNVIAYLLKKRNY